ncbi:MAG: hypothetical protein V3R50_02820 [Gammaproteobacteria bacterium]
MFLTTNRRGTLQGLAAGSATLALKYGPGASAAGQAVLPHRAKSCNYRAYIRRVL